MSKFYIHIGTHKTGSTAIQHALKNHSEILGEEGICYIPKLPAFSLLKNLEEIDNKLISKCRFQLEDKIKAFNLISSNKRFIISYEGLSGNQYNGYRNTSIIAKSLKQIFRDLDVSIIVFETARSIFRKSLYPTYT